MHLVKSDRRHQNRASEIVIRINARSVLMLGLWTSCLEILPGPKEAFASWLVGFSCVAVTKSLKETVADSAWVQSAITTTYGTVYVLNFLYTGEVNNGSII